MAKKFTLPELPYDYKALEPVISAEIMQLHHQKHHNAYVTNLNAALEKYAQAEASEDLNTMISLQPAIRFNGEGTLTTPFFGPTLPLKIRGEGRRPRESLPMGLNKGGDRFKVLLKHLMPPLPPFRVRDGVGCVTARSQIKCLSPPALTKILSRGRPAVSLCWV